MVDKADVVVCAYDGQQGGTAYTVNYALKQNKIVIQINPTMLMYGKEASNRKQEIDRQHYTIPNQRPKDKHCGKI